MSVFGFRAMAMASAAMALAARHQFDVALKLSFQRQMPRRDTTRRRRTTFFAPNGPRECARRIRQGAHLNQLESHKGPHAVRPRHIFGGYHVEG